MKAKALLRLGIFATLASTTLTACGDSTGPTGPFDPELAAAAMEDMVAASEDMNDAFAGITLAGDLFEEEAASAAAVVPAGWTLADADGARAYADGLTALAAPFFPADYLGRTFVWHHGQQRYVEGDATGAPEDGIRIIYYAVDPFTRRPVQPLQPLGHVDLRDLSSASSERLSVQVVNTAGDAEVTLAEYIVDVSTASTSGRVVAEGYLSNGTHRLDFDLANEISFSESAITLEQDFRMGLADTDLSVRYQGSIAFSEQETIISLTTTVSGDGHYLVFHVTVDGEVVEGEVRHGDDVVAVIAGSPEQPTFTDASTGEPLTEAQLEALAEVFQSVARLFELAEGIFGGME